MASPEGHAALFAQELAKYDRVKADIAANVERQRQLLAVVDEKQAAFRAAFGFAEWRRACEVRRQDQGFPGSGQQARPDSAGSLRGR